MILCILCTLFLTFFITIDPCFHFSSYSFIVFTFILILFLICHILLRVYFRKQMNLECRENSGCTWIHSACVEQKLLTAGYHPVVLCFRRRMKTDAVSITTNFLRMFDSYLYLACSHFKQYLSCCVFITSVYFQS